MSKTPARKSVEKPFYGSQELPRVRPSNSTASNALRTGEARPTSDDSS